MSNHGADVPIRIIVIPIQGFLPWALFRDATAEIMMVPYYFIDQHGKTLANKRLSAILRGLRHGWSRGDARCETKRDQEGLAGRGLTTSAEEIQDGGAASVCGAAYGD